MVGIIDGEKDVDNTVDNTLYEIIRRILLLNQIDILYQVI